MNRPESKPSPGSKPLQALDDRLDRIESKLHVHTPPDDD